MHTAVLKEQQVQVYRDRGIEIAPGMKIGYIVRDARKYSVGTEWDAADFDLSYYHTLLEKAWEEIVFAFRTPPLLRKSLNGQEKSDA